MKILLINSVFPGESTGKILNDVRNYLTSKGLDVIVCYGRGNTYKGKGVFRLCSELEAKVNTVFNRLSGLVYGGNLIPTYKLFRIIKREKPDVVHLHCINGSIVNVYRLLNFLAKHKMPTVVTHHAEFFYTGSCGHSFECVQWQNPDGCKACHDYRKMTGCWCGDFSHKAWSKMHSAFALFDYSKLKFTAVSDWVYKRSMQSPIVNKYECIVVQNGLETDIFHYYDVTPNIKQRIPDCSDKFVLHVTASFDSNGYDQKGGHYVLELARQLPNYTFVVVASYINIDVPLPDNVYVWGSISNQIELAQLYSAASVTLLTSKRETFSMVCAESLACGTPVVGFLSGGPESIAFPDVSLFSDYGDVEHLVESIKIMIARDIDSMNLSKRAQNVFSKDIMAQKYLDIYNSMLD